MFQGDLEVVWKGGVLCPFSKNVNNKRSSSNPKFIEKKKSEIFEWFFSLKIELENPNLFNNNFL